jgi:hypothetical protein
MLDIMLNYGCIQMPRKHTQLQTAGKPDYYQCINAGLAGVNEAINNCGLLNHSTSP